MASAPSTARRLRRHGLREQGEQLVLLIHRAHLLGGSALDGTAVLVCGLTLLLSVHPLLFEHLLHRAALLVRIQALLLEDIPMPALRCLLSIRQYVRHLQERVTE